MHRGGSHPHCDQTASKIFCCKNPLWTRPYKACGSLASYPRCRVLVGPSLWQAQSAKDSRRKVCSQLERSWNVPQLHPMNEDECLRAHTRAVDLILQFAHE